MAATVGIARQIGAQPCLPRTWSYRRWFNCPDDWFTRPGSNRSTLEAHQWEGLGHIDERARLYLQDLGLFRDVADEIRSGFQLSQEGKHRAHSMLDKIAYMRMEGAAVLHIRRGDLLTQEQGFQPVLPVSYYRDAIELLGVDEVVVFSDDPDWCRDELPSLLGVKVYTESTSLLRPHGPDYRRAPASDWTDLWLMSYGNPLVISNSTYAWWAAWLGQAERVLYPGTWFGPKLDYIDTSLMFDGLDWEEIPC